MNDRDFEPLIEGGIPDSRHSVFVKALTYNSRVIRLSARFAGQRDHLRLARDLVIAHYRKYVKLSHAKVFPLQYYKYMISPTRSLRISTAGRVIGIFEDVPADPSFGITTANGKKRNYEIGDE